jgi:phosphoribosylglycinamide formyltransferase-1
MRMLKEEFISAFPNRIINIHPSLLPAFRGLEAWKQALEYGVKYTGCTVHFVEMGMDTGPIIMQAVVEVKDDDTPETLHQRIQVQEHIIYPETIRRIAEGRLELRGRRVFTR